MLHCLTTWPDDLLRPLNEIINLRGEREQRVRDQHDFLVDDRSLCYVRVPAQAHGNPDGLGYRGHI